MPRRFSGDRRGLTLIELVLTLTILALAGALVSGAFATGLRAWRSGLRGGREELVARIVLERIAAQLRSAVFSPATLNETAAVAFDAAEDHLRFVTLAANGAAPVQVFYGLRGDGGQPLLVYQEYPWPDKDFFSPGRPRREEMVAEVTGFAVKVFKRPDKPDKDKPDKDKPDKDKPDKDKPDKDKPDKDKPDKDKPDKDKPAGGEDLVTTDWSPLDRELPASVSVEIVVSAAGKPEPRHYQIIVPIPAQGVPR